MENNTEEKIFLFISHSHQDLDKVRCLRNYIESLNAEPILFFLKSLSDKDKITKLIKDEIDARIWFIYCKSPNAERSEWVRTELEHAESTGKRNLLVIDLEKDIVDGALTQEAKIKILNSFHSIRQNTCFFYSYSNADWDIVSTIIDQMKRYGIRTLSTLDVIRESGFGGNWHKEIAKQIHSSPFFLWFVSKNSLSPNEVTTEWERAIQLDKFIFPIVLTSKEHPFDLQSIKVMHPLATSYLENRIYFPFDTDDRERCTNQLINHIITCYERL